MKHVRLQDGVVVEIFDAKPVLHPILMANVMEAPDDVAVGWVWGGSWAVPVDSPPTKDELKAFAADVRFTIETGGVTFNGTTIKTDRESQALITGANALLDADPTMTEVSFKAETGFTTLDRETMKQIGILVGRHVQRLFSAERQMDSLIDAGTITTFEQIKTWEGWNA